VHADVHDLPDQFSDDGGLQSEGYDTSYGETPQKSNDVFDENGTRPMPMLMFTRDLKKAIMVTVIILKSRSRLRALVACKRERLGFSYFGEPTMRAGSRLILIFDPTDKCRYGTSRSTHSRHSVCRGTSVDAF
jgi:hypothetical protein